LSAGSLSNFYFNYLDSYGGRLAILDLNLAAFAGEFVVFD